MKHVLLLLENFTFEDFRHCLGTGICVLLSKGAPVLAIVALVYQIRVLRAKAKREELKLEKESESE